MLTIAAAKAARPRSRAYKLADERGLHLHVSPKGTRTWRLRTRIEGREQLLTIGRFPAVSLTDARARRDYLREQIMRGTFTLPRQRANKTADRLSFEAAALAWHAHCRPDWTAVHADDVLTSLKRDVFPAIGALALDAIDPPAVLGVLRSVEGRGCVETARRLRQRISAVFAFAMSEGRASTDPAAIVERALRPAPAPRRQPALVQVDALRALLDAAELVDALPSIKLASRFLALTAVRMGALLGAQWSEIEDLNGTSPLWRVPAARIKLAAAKKADPTNDHLVPLSAQAVDVLRRADHLAGAGKVIRKNGHNPRSVLIFAGRSGSTPIGAAAIGDLYRRAGFAGRHVPHGWRASFSTIMNEARAEDRAAIDLALGHAPMSKVEAAYNRNTYLDRRRELLQVWGDVLIG